MRGIGNRERISSEEREGGRGRVGGVEKRTESKEELYVNVSDCFT